MALPITGPFYETIGLNVDGPGSYRITRTRYRQKRPYNLPMSYVMSKSQTLKVDDPWGWGVPPNTFGGMANAYTGKNPSGHYAYDVHIPSSMYPELQDLIDTTLNKARAKFVGSLGSSAQLANAVAERKQALGMVASRAHQIFQCFRSIRRGDAVGAVGALGLNIGSGRGARAMDILERKLPKSARNPRGVSGRQRSKDAANLFLEIHFGWTPLVGDIYSACEVLSSPYGDVIAYGRAGGVSNPVIETGSGTVTRTSHAVRVTALVQASFKIENPNVALANQMGLINPLSVLWEITPFSFVVDWFVNVGQFIAQLNDLVGYHFENDFHTVTVRDSASSVRRDNYGYPWAPNWIYQWTVESHCISVERKLGIPSVTLKANIPHRLSPARAATAISLVIQQFLR